MTIFKLGFHFLIIEFKQFLVYFGYHLLSDMCSAKIFLQVCGSPHPHLNCVFHRAEVFNVNKVLLVFSFMDCAFGVVPKNYKAIFSVVTNNAKVTR